jgi:hypothetical protein
VVFNTLGVDSRCGISHSKGSKEFKHDTVPPPCPLCELPAGIRQKDRSIPLGPNQPLFL